MSLKRYEVIFFVSLFFFSFEMVFFCYIDIYALCDFDGSGVASSA